MGLPELEGTNMQEYFKRKEIAKNHNRSKDTSEKKPQLNVEIQNIVSPF